MRRTWITVKRGLLEPKHREKIGQAFWLYLYILDRANWEQGAVLEWIDKNAAEELEMELNTLRSYRRRLMDEGYIRVEKKQHHQKLYINNWTNPREYSGKVYNPQSVEDTELSKDAQSHAQSYTQSTPQSSKQPIRERITPTSNSKDKSQKPKVKRTAASNSLVINTLSDVRDNENRELVPKVIERAGKKYAGRPDALAKKIEEWDSKGAGIGLLATMLKEDDLPLTDEQQRAKYYDNEYSDSIEH